MLQTGNYAFPAQQQVPPALPGGGERCPHTRRLDLALEAVRQLQGRDPWEGGCLKQPVVTKQGGPLSGLALLSPRMAALEPAGRTHWLDAAS